MQTSPTFISLFGWHKGGRVLFFGCLLLAGVGAAVFTKFPELVRQFTAVSAPATNDANAAGETPTALSGWRRIQKRFGFSEPKLLTAIQLLSKNPKFSDTQPLYNLASYPQQVERAFEIVASHRSPDLGLLRAGLRDRFLALKPFPDQSPMATSNSATETFDNLTVYSIVELLYEARDDPRAKEIVSTLNARPASR